MLPAQEDWYLTLMAKPVLSELRIAKSTNQQISPSAQLAIQHTDLISTLKPAQIATLRYLIVISALTTELPGPARAAQEL